MELANQMTHRDKAKAEEDNENLKLDLQEQVTARREKEKAVRIHQAADHEEDQRAHEEYEQILKQETQRMKIRGFTPKPHGKQAWT